MSIEHGPLEAGTQGRHVVLDGLDTQRFGSESEALTAPLPVFGLHGCFALTKKLFLKQSIEFFWITIDDYWGQIIDVNTKLEYNLFKYFGLGVGFNSVRVKIEADDDGFIGSNFLGTLEYNFAGLMLYGKIYF